MDASSQNNASKNAQPELDVPRLAAEALQSLAAFCALPSVPLMFMAPELAAYCISIAVAAYLTALLCDSAPRHRKTENEKDEDNRLKNLRRKMKSHWYVITSERMLTLEDRGIGRDIREALKAKESKDGAPLVEISGTELLDFLDLRLGKERIGEELEIVERYLRSEEPPEKTSAPPLEAVAAR